MNPYSSTSKEKLLPSNIEKQPLEKPRKFQKIMSQPASPSAPLAVLSRLTFIHPLGGRFHHSRIIKRLIETIPLTTILCKAICKHYITYTLTIDLHMIYM